MVEEIVIVESYLENLLAENTISNSYLENRMKISLNQTRDNLETKGQEAFEQIKRFLRNDNLNKEELEKIEEVVKYQLETTNQLLRKETDIHNIDVKLTHIREVPYYLQTDLNIHKNAV